VAAPNLQSPTTITGKTAVLAVTNSASAIVSNASSSGLLKRIHSLLVSNITTSPATLTVDIYRSSTATRITKDLVVPANATIAPITKDTRVDLEEGDDLRLTAGASSTLEAVCSYDQVA